MRKKPIPGTTCWISPIILSPLIFVLLFAFRGLSGQHGIHQWIFLDSGFWRVQHMMELKQEIRGSKKHRVGAFFSVTPFWSLPRSGCLLKLRKLLLSRGAFPTWLWPSSPFQASSSFLGLGLVVRVLLSLVQSSLPTPWKEFLCK